MSLRASPRRPSLPVPERAVRSETLALVGVESAESVMRVKGEQVAREAQQHWRLLKRHIPQRRVPEADTIPAGVVDPLT